MMRKRQTGHPSFLNCYLKTTGCLSVSLFKTNKEVTNTAPDISSHPTLIQSLFHLYFACGLHVFKSLNRFTNSPDVTLYVWISSLDLRFPGSTVLMCCWFYTISCLYSPSFAQGFNLMPSGCSHSSLWCMYLKMTYWMVFWIELILVLGLN